MEAQLLTKLVAAHALALSEDTILKPYRVNFMKQENAIMAMNVTSFTVPQPNSKIQTDRLQARVQIMGFLHTLVALQITQEVLHRILPLLLQATPLPLGHHQIEDLPKQYVVISTKDLVHMGIVAHLYTLMILLLLKAVSILHNLTLTLGLLVTLILVQILNMKALLPAQVTTVAVRVTMHQVATVNLITALEMVMVGQDTVQYLHLGLHTVPMVVLVP